MVGKRPVSIAGDKRDANLQASDIPQKVRETTHWLDSLIYKWVDKLLSSKNPQDPLTDLSE